MKSLKERRQMAENGMCPYCGKGPYTVVVMHAAKGHGIDRFQFRDDLELRYRYPLTSAEYHNELATRRREWMRINGNTIPIRTKGGRVSKAMQNHISEMKQVIAANLDASREALVTDYMAGVSVDDLAVTYGTSIANVYGRLRRAGVHTLLGVTVLPYVVRRTEDTTR